MTDLTAAVEAAARAWHARIQAGRMDAGRFKDDGTPITWDDLTPLDQHAYREIVLPIVTAAAAVLTVGHEEADDAADELVHMHRAAGIDLHSEPILAAFVQAWHGAWERDDTDEADDQQAAWKDEQ